MEPSSAPFSDAAGNKRAMEGRGKFTGRSQRLTWDADLQREQGLTRGWEFIVFIRHWRKEGMRSMLFSPGTKKRNLKDTSDVSIVFYCLDFPGL